MSIASLLLKLQVEKREGNRSAFQREASLISCILIQGQPRRIIHPLFNFDRGVVVGAVCKPYPIHYCFFCHVPNPRGDDIHP